MILEVIYGEAPTTEKVDYSPQLLHDLFGSPATSFCSGGACLRGFPIAAPEASGFQGFAPPPEPSAERGQSYPPMLAERRSAERAATDEFSDTPELGTKCLVRVLNKPTGFELQVTSTTPNAGAQPSRPLPAGSRCPFGCTACVGCSGLLGDTMPLPEFPERMADLLVPLDRPGVPTPNHR